jgi:hypothetical protein
MVMSAPVSLMLPVPAAMVPPVGSAVGGKTAGGSAGGVNAVGCIAIGGRTLGGPAKPGAQNAPTQNAATLSLNLQHELFTPRALRRERSYFQMVV